MKCSTSYKVDPSKELVTRNQLDKAGFKFVDADYAFWRASNGEATITFYHTGKLLVQDRDLDDTIQFLTGIGVITSQAHHNYRRWIGTDESGIGDYFGPLAIAVVLATTETQQALLRIGVRDSKRLSDSAIKKLAPEIKVLCPHSIIVITPNRYNRAYETLPNYGKHYRILAWGHAKAIENILDKETCHYAIADQFGPERFLKSALMEKGRLIRLEQRTHAEDDIAVASASVLAKDAYTKGLEALSSKYSIVLPAGASNKVIEVGRQFVSMYGKDELDQVAKLHFITTHSILD